MAKIKPREIFAFIKILSIEPFLFFYFISIGMTTISRSQLIQDKLCLDEFAQNRSFCVNMNSGNLTEEENMLKSSVLKRSAQFSMYRTIIATIPRLFWSVTIGPWSDKYIHGRKVMMGGASLGHVLDGALLLISVLLFDQVGPVFVLMSTVPTSFVGGSMGVWSGAYGYASVNTPRKWLASRMTMIEVACSIAYPIGTYLGGQFLSPLENVFSGPLRNYITLYAIGTVTQLIAFIWLMVAINERKLQEMKRRENELDINQIKGTEYGKNIDDVGNELLTSNGIESTNKTEERRSFWKLIKQLLTYRNIIEMGKSIIKRREKNYRCQLILLIFTMFFVSFVSNGPWVVMFQFVQKVYNWDAVMYSNIDSYRSIISTIAMLLGVPILEKWFKISHSILGAIASSSVFIFCILAGTWLKSIPFMVGYFISSPEGISYIALRALITVILPSNEIGKIFGALEVIKAINPSLASIIATKIFQLTIDTQPGLIFQFMAGCCCFPILAFLWIHYQKDTDKNINDKNVNVQNDETNQFN